MNCTYPWTSMVIAPDGEIKICCQQYGTNKYFNINIKEIDNLKDFFEKSREYQQARKDFEKGWESVPECKTCVYNRDVLKKKHLAFEASQEFDPSLNTIQYLEFTTSNVCNQACAMCSSKFSTKWKKIDKMFNREVSNTFSLSDQDIEKIFPLLTSLKKLTIKGGEPFADVKNLRILKELYNVNKECRVTIITNGQYIPDQFMEVIVDNCTNDNFSLHASIDATHELYDWVRQGDWKTTTKTLQDFYLATDIKPNITPTVSIFNFFNLNELLLWTQTAGYVNPLHKITNIVGSNDWTHPKNILTQEELDIVNFHIKFNSDVTSKKYDTFVNRLKILNKLRGFDWPYSKLYL